jgi:hypothetical protein
VEQLCDVRPRVSELLNGSEDDSVLLGRPRVALDRGVAMVAPAVVALLRKVPQQLPRAQPTASGRVK